MRPAAPIQRARFQRPGASALLVALAGATPAMAQTTPGTVPNRAELERPAPAPAPARPRLTVDGGVERAPCALDDPAYQAIRIKFAGANFKHLGPVAAEVLRDSYAGYVGTDQPISVVCRIRDAAATRLRALGYFAAVQIPVQRIGNGVVDFEVLYAKVTQIRVVGKVGRTERLLQSYLSHLADGRVFNSQKAERYLLLARDLPGYDVRLSLKPAGTGPGEMIGEVRVNYIPVMLDFTSDDFAAPSTGRYSGQLRAVINGLTGQGDRTVIALSSSAQVSKQQVLQLGHEMALGGEGLRLGGHFTYAWTQPALGPTVPPIAVRTLFANLEASYPLRRSQASSLRAALGLDLVNQKVRFAGLPLSQDHLRTGYLRLDAEAVDLAGTGPDGTPGWRVNASLEARQGLSLLGASPNCLANLAVCTAPGFVPPALPGANPTAGLLRFGAMIETRPLRHWVVTFTPRAQLASGPLMAFERFSAGNYTIGRGYDPGALTGDDGFGYQSEVRYESIVLSPTRGIDLKPYLFADSAWLWDRAAATHQPRQLATLGGGVRIGLGPRARIDLSGAAPLVLLPGEVARRDPRFLMSFAMSLYPWSAR